MKKLLSVFAAAAMLFGFASCSGDLHDAQIIDLTGYGIRGTMTGWDAAADIPLVDNGDGTYSISFAAQDPNGTGIENVAVLELGDGSWNTAYRLAQPKSEGDAANVFGEADGWEQKVYQGQSADCMSIPAAKGDNVTLLITPSTTYITVKVTVEGGAAPAAPVPFYLDGYFVCGAMNGWVHNTDTLIYGAKANMTTGELEYIYKFTASGTEHEFGICTPGWASKYTGATFAVGTDEDFVATELGADANNKITGLTADANYQMTIKTTTDGVVSFYVEEIVAYTVKFKIINLGDVTEAWVNGAFWSGWSTGWPLEAWGGKGANFTDVAAAAVVDGVAEMPSAFDVSGVAKPGTTISNEVKFVASSDAWASTAYDNPNIAVEFEVTEAGTYLVTIDADANEATVQKL